MNRLSRPLEDLRAEYDIVVVGSGYGGAVAACRLAQKAQKAVRSDGSRFNICLLERGQERHAGEYPRTFLEGLRSVRVSGRVFSFGSRKGMFDLQLNDDISILTGSGLGGTSLINAGVMLKPDCATLRSQGWPDDLFDEKLEAGFERSAKMIDPSEYPHEWPHLNKRQALAAIGEFGAEVPSEFQNVPIAVSFKTHVNSADVQLRACRLCGDCVTGCNHSAKNTLLMNYIPAAVEAGAEVFCGASVRWLEPAGQNPENDGWLLHLEPLDGGWRYFRRSEGLTVRAKIVILAAGTLGTTEILHRSGPSSMGRIAPSDRLGEHFSGNGDVLAFGYNNDVRVDGFGCGKGEPDQAAPVGPTITAMLDERKTGRGSPIVIQEGAIPRSVAVLVRVFAPLSARISLFGGSAGRPRLPAQLRAWWREFESFVYGVKVGSLRNTQTYLVLGDDSDGGTDMGTIGFKDDRARVRWPAIGRQRLFREVNERLRRATVKLGGSHVANPFWSEMFGWQLITVHPLGGCRMADNSGEGVVNHKGQVFRTDRGASGATEDVYANLYACDGSVIPTPLGVNPLWTISAIAERTTEMLYEDHGEALGAAAPPEPEREGFLPSRLDVDTSGPDTSSPNRPRPLPRGPARSGVTFSERMRGTLTPCAADGQEKGSPSPFEFVLYVGSPDAEAMVTDPDSTAGVTGLVSAPGLSPTPLRVDWGRFTLFAGDTKEVETRRMIYRLRLMTRSGDVFWLHGSKIIHAGPGRWRAPWNRVYTLWREFTTLEFTLHRGEQEPKAGAMPFARGKLRLHWLDLMRGAASIRVTHAAGVREMLHWKLRFLGLYLTVTNRAFGTPWGRSRIPDPFTDVPGERRLFDFMDAPDLPGEKRAKLFSKTYSVMTEDRVTIYLRRFANSDVRDRPTGDPVILAPGFASSTFCYVATSPYSKRNFTEYLVEQGYDVWLLDYRSSELSPGSGTQFTLDEIARYDFPAAVRKVYEESGGQKVRVLGHCMASAALLMALLRGWLDSRMVRSAVCSQVFLFFDAPLANKVKNYLRLPDALYFLRFWPTLTSNVEGKGNLPTRMLDGLLRLYPSHERCHSPICRRILLLYGEVCRHDQLDPVMHAALPDMFNRSNLSTLIHIGRVIRNRKVVDSAGRDVYVQPDNAKRIDVPVTLVQGGRNGIFLRSGGRDTYQWLKSHEHPDRSVFYYEEFEEYGHLDVFIGRHTYSNGGAREEGAPQATYDSLREFMDRTATAP
ncbi:MAG: alpha/beta fold hydrolase [Gemmatimonadota bacterium]